MTPSARHATAVKSMKAKISARRTMELPMAGSRVGYQLRTCRARVRSAFHKGIVSPCVGLVCKNQRDTPRDLVLHRREVRQLTMMRVGLDLCSSAVNGAKQARSPLPATAAEEVADTEMGGDLRCIFPADRQREARILRDDE